MDIFFNGHVSEFTGIKDIAAFQALDELCVFFSGHDADARMPTDFLHSGFFGRLFRDW